jgi:predicted SAM-dependent methyltransferase
MIIDKQFKTSLYERAIKLEKIYYSSIFLNLIRRNINPLIVKLKYKLRTNRDLLKLHLGCGSKHLSGYVNIDWRKTNATDLVLDIKKLPYPDNSVVRIETYHVIEHLSRYDLIKTLKEWHRVLKIGGQLIIEFPDFDKIVKKYLEGDEKQLDGIFGLQRFKSDYHFFGYNFKRLKGLLEGCGFSNIEGKKAKDYHSIEWSCIRIECFK